METDRCSINDGYRIYVRRVIFPHMNLNRFCANHANIGSSGPTVYSANGSRNSGDKDT